MTNGHDEPALSEREQEIIAVGASIASGCLPCTKYHLRAAASAGASEREVLDAVRDATQVRRAATEIMARAGGLTSAEASEPIPEPTEAPSMIRELVSVSAAYALACSTSLGPHIAAARALGATNRQVFAAIALACGIRDVACSKAKTAAGAALGVSDDRAAPCCDGDGAPSASDASGCAPGTHEGADAETCVCEAGGHQR